MESLVIAFSAHPEQKYNNFPEVVERIDIAVRQICKSHPGSRFILGAEMGAELTIARVLLSTHQNYTFFLPCLNWLDIIKNQNKEWGKELNQLYKKAHGFFAPHSRLENDSYSLKNKEMIDQADVLVAFTPDCPGSHTQEAIEMARQKKIKIYNALHQWEEI